MRKNGINLDLKSTFGKREGILGSTHSISYASLHSYLLPNSVVSQLPSPGASLFLDFPRNIAKMVLFRHYFMSHASFKPL